MFSCLSWHSPLLDGLLLITEHHVLYCAQVGQVPVPVTLTCFEVHLALRLAILVGQRGGHVGGGGCLRGGLHVGRQPQVKQFAGLFQVLYTDVDVGGVVLVERLAIFALHELP